MSAMRRGRARGIVLRLDADHRTGLAHAVRVRNLLASLATEVRSSVVGSGDSLPKFFPDSPIAQPSNMLDLIRVANESDALLIDLPAVREVAWAKLAETVHVPMIVVDDYGGDIQADLIVNGTVIDAYHKYPAQVRDGRIFCGGQYALLHPAFGETQWHRDRAEGITVVVGGGDRAVRWAFALVGGSPHFAAEMAIVVGHSFPDAASLKSRCAAQGVAFHQALDSPELAKLLSASAVAIVTGGMIVYECLALGVPAIIFPQEQNLVREADWFERKGYVVNLGHEGGMNINAVAATANELLADADRLAALSAAGRAIIDGKGTLRVAAAIDELLAG